LALARHQQLSADELGDLAERLASSNESAMTRGFYDESSMPEIRRQNLTPALYADLLERVRERSFRQNISATGEEIK